MAYELWSQDNFTKGELSPFMYARATVLQYYNGLKTAQNVLTYPTGAAGKRFGTYYQATLSNVTSSNEIYFSIFQYLNECIYQLIFRPDNIDIYLEGILVATVTTTGLDGEDCFNLDSTVLNSAFRIAGEGFKPKDLTRSAAAANIIVSSSVDLERFGITNALTADIVLPVQFTTAGTLPSTEPQIKIGITYFVYTEDATHVEVYSNPIDAKARTNKFVLNDIGTGVNNLIVLNTWALTDVVFKNRPVYDFNGGYDAITFTPSAVSGAAVTLTASGAIFSAAFVGGGFVGNGGVARITGFTDTTHVTVAVQTSFGAAAAIQGSLCFLAEPAWSDARGWPQKCSSYQNRAIFCNSTSLPNGFWASAINGYPDFNDLESDDDNAISWYPTSNDINYIRFIVPYRSLTVHTNSGIYSSPLSEVNAITPKTFSLQLQDSTPADVLQPQAIDNQIIVLSGNDAHTMLWDGINNAYTSDIVSVVNEQLIRDPVDEAAYADLHRAGSRYVFIINENGSMAVYQTLISQDVAGFTPQIMEQEYGNAYFRQASSSTDGRCWFVTERQIGTGSASYLLTANTANTLTAPGLGLVVGVVTKLALTLTPGGVAPTSTPQVTNQVFYWAVGETTERFKLYLSEEDAIDDENEILFSDHGTDYYAVGYPLTTQFFLEELTFDAHMDCMTYYSGTPTSTIDVGGRFEGNYVKMIGDGFGFEDELFGQIVTFTSHGDDVEVSEAYIGFPINYRVEPMPLSMAAGANIKANTLTFPKHIRAVRFMFNNTIGGTINGVPIALNKFDSALIGEPPIPANGIFEWSGMQGWDDFNNPIFTIEHDEPFDIQLLGVFYSVETTD